MVTKKIIEQSSVMAENKDNLSSTERIKTASDNLRGTLVDSLHNEITGNLNEDDVALVRFHGMYVQDDRDRRAREAQAEIEGIMRARRGLRSAWVAPLQ